MTMTCDEIKRYAFRLDDFGNVIGTCSTGEDPGAEVDRLCREYTVSFKCSYQQAFQAVTSDPANRDVVHAYAMS